MNNVRLLLLGNPGIEHVGSHFREAAAELGLDMIFVDAGDAFEGSYVSKKVNWWLRGHRPNRIQGMSANLVRICRDRKPDLFLTTGFAPVNVPALKEIGALGIPRLNFLTDDPWNPSQAAPWFVQALPYYDCVFSPRESIMEDLRKAGCRQVQYLPFAYAPHVHFPEAIGQTEERQLASDVIFAGGGDKDRVPYLSALREAGFRIALYGGYWDGFRGTRSLSRGIADVRLLRKAMAAAKVGLCLVRRQNRDGHCMRSFELPAFGVCALVEYTKEHEEIFGADSNAVVYFDSVPRMIDKMHWLLAHDSERRRLASAAHRLIASRPHTYRDRLQLIVESALPTHAAQRRSAN